MADVMTTPLLLDVPTDGRLVLSPEQLLEPDAPQTESCYERRWPFNCADAPTFLKRYGPDNVE